MKLWHGKEAVLQWDRAWERTTGWESEGGRTMDVTTDTSYERYLEETESDSEQEGDRILVRVSSGNWRTVRQGWLEACIAKVDHWVVMTRKGNISTEQTRALEQYKKLIGR